MKRLLTIGFALAGFIFTSTPVQAWGCRDKCCEDSCAAPCYEEKTITVCRPKVMTREVMCTVTKKVPVCEVTQKKVSVMVPVWTEEKRVCTSYEKKCREVEREFTVCSMVKECVTDPCTGCTHTVCKPVTEVRKEKCTVVECVPVQKDVMVKVCSYKCEERIVECRQTVYKCVEVTECRKERYVAVVPCEIKVKVRCKAPATCCN